MVDENNTQAEAAVTEESQVEGTATDTTDVPDRLKTVYSEVDLRCPRCRAQWSPSVAIFVNLGTDPMGREGILRKSMHHAFCPVCKYHTEIDHIFAVYIPEQNTVVQVRMPWEFKAGGGEDVYWTRLEDFVLKYADMDVKVDVVFGFDELIDKYLGGTEASEAAIERAKEEKKAGLKPGALSPGVETVDTGTA